MRSTQALWIILAILLCLLVGACGGAKNLLSQAAAPGVTRAASHAGPPSEWYMEGGNLSHSRYVASAAGPRRANRLWQSDVPGLNLNGCREFAIDGDGKLYVHPGIPAIGVVDEATGDLMYLKSDLPGGTPSSRWQSAIGILHDGKICHVEPVDEPNTCQLVVYEDVRATPQFIERARVTIGGSVAYSPCVVLGPSSTQIFVVTDASPPTMQKYVWNGAALAPEWSRPMNSGVTPTPPIYVESQYNDYVFTAVQMNYSPNEVRVYGMRADGYWPQIVSNAIQLDARTMHPSGLTFDGDAMLFFTASNFSNQNTVYGISTSGALTWSVEVGSLVSGACGLTGPAIVPDDWQPGLDSVYVGVKTTGPSGDSAALLGLDALTGDIVYGSVAFQHTIDPMLPENDLAVDQEHKIYMPCNGALYCFEPHPINLGGQSYGLPIWSYDFSPYNNYATYSAHIGPNGNVYVAVAGGTGLDYLHCFGPGNLPIRLKPLWEQWGNGNDNERCGTENEGWYRGTMALANSASFPDLQLCSSAVTATSLTAPQEEVWVNDQVGGLHRVTNGVSFTRTWDFIPPVTTGAYNQFASPTIQADGKLAYIAGGTTLIGLYNDISPLTAPDWVWPLGPPGQFSSPCIVHDGQYGGMRVYVGDKDAFTNSYIVRCYLDNGEVVWTNPPATGLLLGTPAYVEMRSLDGDIERNIFVTVLQNPNIFPNLYDVLGFDGDTGVLVYEARNLLGNWGPPYPPTEYSVLYNGRVLVATTPRRFHGFTIPPRGGGVTQLTLVWSTANPYFIAEGACLKGNSLYITTSDSYNMDRSVVIDAMSGMVTWSSDPYAEYETFSRPVVDLAGYLYVAGQSSLVIYQPYLGTAPIQDIPLPGPVNGSPALGTRGVYLSTEDPVDPNDSLLNFITF